MQRFGIGDGLEESAILRGSWLNERSGETFELMTRFEAGADDDGATELMMTGERGGDGSTLDLEEQ